MKGHLLVCDEITTDRGEKAHILGKVLNAITIPVLPYVFKLHVLTKIIDISDDETIDLSIQVIDSDQMIIGQIEAFSTRNYRSDDQIPGVDIHTVIPAVICKTGIIKIHLLENGALLDWYPLTIRVSGNSYLLNA